MSDYWAAAAQEDISDPALEVEDLSCVIDTPEGEIRLVDNVSLSLGVGRTLGIVGESGSGKTMLVKSIVGIQPRSARVSGRVMLGGVNVLELSRNERRRLVGKGIGMIFQNPMTSLNPVVPIGRQIVEGLRYHRSVGAGEARTRAVELLEQVGISEPAARLRQYPHQLSGGMRQRVVIASALACNPAVLIADEATTALDVTVQKQILDLIKEVQAERNMASILISHDLEVVAGRADHVAVMYSGQVVECGSTHDIFDRARHRYTAALLMSAPDLQAPVHSRLPFIAGTPPSHAIETAGCRFADRCHDATEKCKVSIPEVSSDENTGEHWYRCHWPRATPDQHGDTRTVSSVPGVS